MKAKQIQNQNSIDAVITWVDGSTQTNCLQRQYYLTQAGLPLHENAINPHRWTDNDEISFCLQSIDNNAPWVRTIWIVTAGEIPDLSSLSSTLKAKIKFVEHRDIFGGFEVFLPTFNSLAIESLIWRIDGLSERFLYFNDDVFLTKPLIESDVFCGLYPVVRGYWANRTALVEHPGMQSDPTKFNDFMQINAARMVNFDAQNIFSTAHVVHPLRRSKMEQLFRQYPDDFTNNVQHRFRDLSQFLPQGLHNHSCIAENEAIIETTNDHLHINSGQGNDRPVSETLTLLQNIIGSDIKFLCVNDLPQIEKILPNTRHWLEHAIGGFPNR